ncbi:tachykinin-3 isoform X1 [Heliangelus exortis]|uniref:tachykinin-3 isoform X1 n=1 Tax=Heliangelus exortis TaxID=472823 RepID=UPI003A957EE6
MRSHPALAALLVLALPFALGRRPPVPPGPAPPAQVMPSGRRLEGCGGRNADPQDRSHPLCFPQAMPVPEPLPRRARDSTGAAYAALLQLLEEEEEAGGPAPAAPQKRKSRPVPVPSAVPGPAALTAGLSAGDMHDFFVGLMGKRAEGRGSGGPNPRCSPGPPAAPLRAA